MIEFSQIVAKYGSLTNPAVKIEVNGIGVQMSKDKLQIAYLDVDLTAGYEASTAVYRITNCYNMNLGQFKYGALKPFIMLGSAVTISLGYNGSAGPVFKGYISKVEFAYDSMDETTMPYCEVTCMDVKGIMMSNRYQKQLLSRDYSGAVSELFALPQYMALQVPPKDIMSSMKNIVPTPDVATSALPVNLDRTIEMYDESDYEFVVRAAKRFNYDFFVVAGEVNFFPAKLVFLPFMKLTPKDSMRSVSVTYDIAGMVGGVEVRNMDPDKGIPIVGKKKMPNKLSGGPIVKTIVKPQTKVVVDNSIRDTVDAAARADFIADQESYRFGTIEAEFVGIPDIPPAVFVQFDGLGSTVDNSFYITRVRHIMDKAGYITRVTGRAASLSLGL